MLENDAKGWHGNYSVIGRNIVERFQLLLRKDEIISGKLKKIAVKDFFETEEKEERKRNKNSKELDIFSESFDKQKKEKLKKKNEEKKIKQADLCSSEPKYEFKERYKFHQSHHGDIKNKLMKIKENNINTIASYNPKMDLVWKKAKNGPFWKLIKGREIFNNINDNLYKEIKEKKENSLNLKKNKSKNIKKFDSMDKQTKRGIMPISYDLRIRTDKAFIPRNKMNLNNKNTNIKISISNIKTPKNKNIYLNISENNKNKAYLNTYSNQFQFTKTQKILNTDFSRNKGNLINDKKNNIKVLNLKKKIEKNNLNFSPFKVGKNILLRTIDFSKTLPRDTNLFLIHNYNRTSQPLFNPSYKLIEPRSLTMVSYSKKTKNRSNPKKFEGEDPQLFYEANKVINKINNHKEVNAPNFNIMAGRNLDNGPLPAFMVNLYDRKSLETITDKGLKMNNYANIDFQKNYSTFNPKKSFNKLINYTVLKNDKEIVDEQLKKINKEIFGDNKLKKLIEKYSDDENKNKDYNSARIDGITLKSIKNIEIHNKIKHKPLDYQF